MVCAIPIIGRWSHELALLEVRYRNLLSVPLMNMCTRALQGKYLGYKFWPPDTTSLLVLNQ